MRRAWMLLFCLPLATAEDEPDASAFRCRTDPRVRIAVDRKEIRPGDPTARELRDLIPAIWEPEAIPAARAIWLRSGGRVLGLEIGGEARAYALRILEDHGMVNNVLGGQPVAPDS